MRTPSEPLVVPRATYHGPGGRYVVAAVRRGVVHGRRGTGRRAAPFAVPVDDFFLLVNEDPTDQLFGPDVGDPGA